MRTDKALAIKLRLSGKSYSEIQKVLKRVSKSTLSEWLKDIILSDLAKNKILKRSKEKSFQGLLKRNKNQTTLAIKRRDKIRKLATLEIKDISSKDLFFIGLALYWAEGYKQPIRKNGREVTYHPISLTNSDPNLIKIFLRFLREFCKVPEEKIKIGLRIFKHLNEKEVISFWTKITGIPEKNFQKTYLGISKSSMGKRPYNRLPYGIIQIRINDTNLFHKIMGWIEGIKNFV